MDEDFYNHSVILLVFEGVDTFASLNANNMEFEGSINMFMRYTFSIKNLLHVGDNEVTVIFLPSERVANALAGTPTNTYGIPPECPDPAANGLCHINRIRKMQASYSWDWGPAVASMGIW